MRTILFSLLLLSVFSVQGWGGVYDCSAANNAKVRINQIYNPQTGNETGYLEIYVDNGPVNLEGWQVCYGDGSHNKCVNIGSGDGDVYLDGVLLGNDSDASNIPDNAFVVFSEALFATSGNPENTFAQSAGEAVLLDSNGDAAHYLKYHNSTFNQADWSAAPECTTDFVQPTANNNGICATPDFSQPDSQWSYNCDNTMGTYNADPASPLAEWRMDECFWNGTGGEVRDSKSSHHGTSKGLNTDARVATTVENGILNRAGEFRGEGYNADPYNTWYTARYYLDVPDADALSPLSLTQSVQMSITGWFKLSSASGTHTILHKGGNNQEYRVFVEDGIFKFTVWDIWGSAKTVVVNTPLVENQPYFFTVTAQGSLLALTPLEITAKVKNGTNTYTQNASFPLFTYNLLKNENLYFGATQWGNTITNFLNGYIDEIKLYNKTLTSSEIDRLYTYESSGRNYDGTPRASDTCYTPPPECTSFGYDLYHTSNPYRLQTRIASQPFDVNVTVVCSGTGAIPSRTITKIYAITGSCPANTAGLPVLWSGSADINETHNTITLSGLNSLQAFPNVALMLETDSGELNCSSDTFAIRPSSFHITAPSSSIPAGLFTLQVSATNSGGGYNGTANATTALQTADPDCPVSSNFLKTVGGASEPLSLAFADDVHTSQISAADIGDIYLSLADTTWTSVDHYSDCVADSNATIADSEGRFGCNIENNLSLRITPHHFDLNATLSDFEGGAFTYLSDDLNMSAELDIKVTAKNGEGNTTLNYTEGCYAKDATLTLAHSTVPNPLSRILYNLNGAESNVTKSNDIVLNLQSSVFSQGVAPLLLRLNFDRDPAQPANPFDFTIQTATVLDTDAISNTGGITELAGTATFVYGRVRAYDITTNETSAPNPVEFEVYSAAPGGYVNGMPQNVLKWYRHTNHDTAAAGNVIRGGFTPGSDDIDVSAIPSNGIQTVIVSASEDKTVHLDIPSWLWYSSVYDYDYSADCSRHPCFRYIYTGSSAGVTGVTSGTFRGSDFEMKPAENITNKGVKVFR